MTKEQYLKVIERVIDSPRNDKLKITRLKNAFEQYVAETNERIIEKLEDKKWGTSEWRDKWRDEIIGECIEVVKEEGGIE